MINATAGLDLRATAACLAAFIERDHLRAELAACCRRELAAAHARIEQLDPPPSPQTIEEPPS